MESPLYRWRRIFSSEHVRRAPTWRCALPSHLSHFHSSFLVHPPIAETCRNHLSHPLPPCTCQSTSLFYAVASPLHYSDILLVSHTGCRAGYSKLYTLLVLLGNMQLKSAKTVPVMSFFIECRHCWSRNFRNMASRTNYPFNSNKYCLLKFAFSRAYCIHSDFSSSQKWTSSNKMNSKEPCIWKGTFHRLN